MNIPGAADRNDREGDARAGTDGNGTVGAVEHYSCGLAGLLATAVAVVFLYPVLVSLTRPLHLLSTVTLVFIVITAWVLVWLTFELVWEWRSGRLLA